MPARKENSNARHLGAVVVLALVTAAAKAVAAVPWYVWAALALVPVAAIGGLVALFRVQRRDAATLAARAAARQALPVPAQAVPARPAPMALPPAGQHLTLNFHGDVDPANVAGILAAVRNQEGTTGHD